MTFEITILTVFCLFTTNALKLPHLWCKRLELRNMGRKNDVCDLHSLCTPTAGFYGNFYTQHFVELMIK